MSATASGPLECHINSLPEETLEWILDLAAVHHQFLDQRNTKALLNFTLTCKRWLNPARRILYRRVTLSNCGQAMLLHRLLEQTNPSLRTYVKSLDPQDIWRAGPTAALAMLLHTTPNLEWLAVFVRQCHQLRDNATWRQLKGLQITSDNSQTEQEKKRIWIQEDLPSTLETLELHHFTHFSQDTFKWSDLDLPYLRTIRLHKTHISGYPRFNPSRVAEDVKFLPKMPSLTAFEIRTLYCPYNQEEAGQLLCKLIKEFSQQIKFLLFEECGAVNFILSSGLLCELPQLQSIDLIGSAIEYLGRDAMRSIFPSSIRRLSCQWSDSVEFGMELLTLLADRDDIFLPNLESVPTLIFTHRIEEEGGWPPTRHQVRSILQLSYRAQASLLARGTTRLTELNLPWLHDVAIIMLPFPRKYKDMTSEVQYSVMKDLVARNPHLVCD